MSKELRIVVRCGDCMAAHRMATHRDRCDGTEDERWRRLVRRTPEEHGKYLRCEHRHSQHHGLVTNATHLAHPVPTPWFVYLYGEPV